VADSIFVTGATGTIGRRVVTELLARGYKVDALVRSKTQKVPGTRQVIGNLRGLHKVIHKVGRCDAAIHLASTRSDDVYRVFNDDVLGSLQLAAMFGDRPIVYASSQTVYGIPTSRLKESQVQQPVTWYDFGLCASEQIMNVSHNYNTKNLRVICRLAPVLVRAIRKTDKQFFTPIFEHCDNGGTFLVDSAEGKAQYGTSFVGPGDVARAIVDCLSLKESTTVNVSSGFTTWSDLIENYNSITGGRGKIIVRNDVDPRSAKEKRLPQSRSYLDRAALRKATGFQPQERLRGLIKAYSAAAK
jgi:nucleoside-diphosphate-sugar epimerase